MLGSEQEHFCVLAKELQEITNSLRTGDKRFRVQQLGVISSGPSPFIGCPLPGTTTTSLCLVTSDPTTSSWALQVISPNMGKGSLVLPRCVPGHGDHCLDLPWPWHQAIRRRKGGRLRKNRLGEHLRGGAE